MVQMGLRGTLPGGPRYLWGNPFICTLPAVGQGLAPLEIHGPLQGQEARGFLEAGVLLARGHQAGEVEEDRFSRAQEARLQILAGLSRDDWGLEVEGPQREGVLLARDHQGLGAPEAMLGSPPPLQPLWVGEGGALHCLRCLRDTGKGPGSPAASR